jgi:hypothetical protein
MSCKKYNQRWVVQGVQSCYLGVGLAERQHPPREGQSGETDQAAFQEARR